MRSHNTRLVVGCPVRDRAWIIYRWFEHTQRAIAAAGISSEQVMYVFVGDHSDDDTFREIDRACLDFSVSRHVIDRPGSGGPYDRTWGWNRYLEMAELRNALLGVVREAEPDLYWSLDSDILVSRTALASAIDALDHRAPQGLQYDAVGQRCYMTPAGTWCPSYAMQVGSAGLSRDDSDGLFRVDVIMAAKVLTPKAYAVDYAAHYQGEDIGWSEAARKAGCTLAWDGRTVSKHVMGKEFLHTVDQRCGF
jgi:hypothetical protein